MSEPLVDILMATYNGERYIGEQIESIRRQTWRNWRLLVSDDCSNDGTLDIVRGYAAEDDRIRIVSEGVRFGGAKENFFSLMREANAPYVMFCDQDDVWRDDKIAVELNVILDSEAAHGGSCPIMAHSNLALIGKDGVVLDGSMHDLIADVDFRSANPAQLLFTGVATGCTMLMNRACIDKCLAVECIDDVNMHDWWVALVASMLGVRVYIDEMLVFYRQHENNVIGAPLSKAAEHNSMGSKLKKYASIVVECRPEDIAGEYARFYRYCIGQARVFRRVYQNQINPDWAVPLNKICCFADYSLFQKIATLNKYHLWKRGIREKLRQTLALGWLLK